MIPTYPEPDLWQELVELGGRLHWSLDELLGMAHSDRLLLVELVRAEGRARGGDPDG